MVFKHFVNFFSRIGLRYFSNYLRPLKEVMIKSNLNILFEVYVGRMMFFATLAFFASFVSIFFFMLFMHMNVFFSLAGAIIVSIGAAFGVLTLFHSYPFQLISSKKASIEGNMPFAINHMGAIAASGVPPFVIFKLISNIPEYMEVAHEAKRIVRNVEVFGMDLSSAMKNVADRTPSAEFKQFLYGVVAMTETGGELKIYMENSAKEALVDYRLKRERYQQVVSTYADFYTAILIAAPLFFISVLSIMSLIGGQVLGMDIPTAMKLGVYLVLPLLNISFILFIHFTQPAT